MNQPQPRVAAIIQARMTSSRLPGKVLADLDGQPVLAFMLGRVRRARLLDAIVVATTVNASDDPVAELAGRAGVTVFRGDEMDVLGRFEGAAAAAGADIVVRLTADCPLTDPALVDRAVALFRQGGADYVSNILQRTYPDGLDVEVMSRAALQRACREATQRYDREHVTPYIYRNAGAGTDGGFRVVHMLNEADFAHLRWTIDTAADLDRLRTLLRRAPTACSWLQALAAATWEPALLGVTPPPDPAAEARGQP